MTSLSTIKLSVDEFIAIEDSKANRIGSNRLNKKHLKGECSPLHQVVAIGCYEDGRRVIIDGHSRKAAWQAGQLDKPDHLEATVFKVSSLNDEIVLINIYCGTSSVATPKELAEQARNRNALTFKSDLCNSPWGAAMKAAGYKVDEGYKEFANALKWLDDFDLSVKDTKRLFSAGVRAGFLETFKDFNQQAKVFWADYVKPESTLKQCLELKASLLKQDGWGGSAAASFRRQSIDLVKSLEV